VSDLWELGLRMGLMVIGEDKKKDAEQSLPNMQTSDLPDIALKEH
jgi:hypothetical protein